MLTCLIECASRLRGNNEVPVPGAYCCHQYLIPKYKDVRRPHSTIPGYYIFETVKVGKMVAREWAIQVEHLEDLARLVSDYSNDSIIVYDTSNTKYDFHVVIYDDYVE